MEGLIVAPAARALEARRPREGYVIKLIGRFDRHEAEALRVEIKVLAKRHRLAISDVDVRRVTASGRSA
jgi:homoserine dehydrogenase